MLIEVENLKKSFGRRAVLEGVDFQVAPGEVVALAGLNGAGKSTTVLLLMGLLEAEDGRLRVLGVDPRRQRHLGRVGWMPESPAFPATLGVGAALRFQEASFPTWDPALAAELTDMLEIDPGRRCGVLSRGETARLALVMAVAHRPELLLLDDPTLGLDPAGRRLLQGEILAAAAESGTGVLVSTHLLDEFETSLDRLLILHRGRVDVDETIETLKSRHRRLTLPPDSPPPPAELEPLAATGSWLLRRWDAALGRRLMDSFPLAQIEPITLEDLFVTHTGGAQ